MKTKKPIIFLLVMLLLLSPLPIYAQSFEPYQVILQSQKNTIKLDKSSCYLQKGKTVTLKATVTPKTSKVTWSTSDKNIATVDQKGKVTGKKNGKVKIYAKNSYGSKAQCTITVINPTISNTKVTLKQNGSKKTLSVKGAVSKVTWKSSKTSVAKVSSKGVVTPLKAGTATITAAFSGIKLTCAVTVKKKSSSVSEVWISATGAKYHKINNCGRMNPNKATKLKLSDAIKRGYEACDKCF